jgi:hypothetical protein
MFIPRLFLSSADVRMEFQQIQQLLSTPCYFNLHFYLRQFHKKTHIHSLSTINNTLNLPAMTGSGSSGDDRTTSLTPPISYRFGIMPHLDHGAFRFDNTEFLYRCSIECEDFGVTDPQKFIRLPDYYTSETKDTIELLSGQRQ